MARDLRRDPLALPAPIGDILIVDDDPESLRILSEILKKAGHQIRTAASGELALEAAGSKAPDLILLDVVMPVLDGFEVCRRLKDDAATANVSVIFVSGLIENAEQRKGFACGAVDYITKPFDPTIVRARVQIHVAHALTRGALSQQNAALEDRVSTRTTQLQDALSRVHAVSRETIFRLAKAAEFRDDDTGSHIVRMSRYAALIATSLGLAQNVVDEILYAAPLHDIGKIGIPDGVLLKPGKLDEAEWSVMRGHPHMGARILADSNLDVLKLGEVIAHTHHERWDGGGYPQGLAGEDIPIAGRIVAVADVFDALTSRRPYKEPFSVERAFEIIREERGSHFDPTIVDAFLAVDTDVLAVYGRSTSQQLAELLALDNGNGSDAIFPALDN
jgi:putative two-component system response regulator